MEVCLKLHLATLKLKGQPKAQPLDIKLAATPAASSAAASNGGVQPTASVSGRPASAAAAGPRSPADIGRGAAAVAGSVPVPVAAVPAVAKATGRRGMTLDVPPPLPAANGTSPTVLCGSLVVSPTSTASTTVSPTGRPGSGAATPRAMHRPIMVAPAVAAAATAAAAVRVPASARAPKTSTEFEAAWRGFGTDMAAQQAYLALLEPAVLPAVFKSSLTPQLLSAMLRALLAQLGSGIAPSDAGAALHAVALLDGLTAVPRFDMTLMCVPGKEKKELREMAATAQERLCTAAPAAAERMTAVRRKYKL